jgi:branched-chain amino acid transport system substrate-binding protein
LRRAAVAVAVLVLAAVAGAAAAPPSERDVLVSGCEGVYYEASGRPDVLIVSDLPLESSAHTAMHQMTQAIKLTLKDDGFRAGRRRVGYVVCDDSGSTGGWSSRRCARNARAAVSSRRVVGVIGTLDSGCARAELPILGASKLLLVSPLNTAPDLTRRRGARVARLSAADDVQARAAARFVHGRGCDSVLALSDGTARGDATRAWFAAAARRLGLRVRAHGRADAAYLAGLLSPRSKSRLANARRLVHGGPVVLSAGYGPAAQLAADAGALAEGAYLVVAGLPVERLPEAGAQFVTHFESAIGTSPHPYAVYAAEAARLLLDAIAAAGTSRDAVGRAVLATKVEDGLIGPVSFDRNGDPSPAPVTVLGIHDNGTRIVRVVDSGLP